MFVVVVMLFGDRYANPIVTRTGTLIAIVRISTYAWRAIR
jgi:hypothetical protein